MLESRRLCFAAIRRTASQIVTGMTEEDGVAVLRRVLREQGLVQEWHGASLRIGANTRLAYDVSSKPGVALGENDIFFIDIGPVWRDCEADGCDTFVIGHDPEMHRIASDARDVFETVRSRWLAERLTGQGMYRIVAEESQARGWLLDPLLTGHRVSDFPHAAHHDGALADVAFVPSPNLWILEIQLRHPTRPFGAFYEDLLTDT